MKTLSILTLAVAAAFGTTAFAQPKAAEGMVLAASAPGKAAMAGTITITAKVVAIDAATRTLTLMGAKGNVLDVVAPPEAKKFDQIRVGDTVTTEYVRALTLELKPTAGGGMRSMTSQAASAPAPAGAVAGGAVGRQVVIMARVTAVNTKEKYVTLRGPKGNSVDLKVGDPAQLKLVKVGDMVEAVYTEAVAITVDHTPAPAKK